jgi:hypothetical protein
MAKKLSGLLYGLARGINRAASAINDIETVGTLDPRKIGSRAIRKAINKASYTATRKFTKKFK